MANQVVLNLYIRLIIWEKHYDVIKVVMTSHPTPISVGK